MAQRKEATLHSFLNKDLRKFIKKMQKEIKSSGAKENPDPQILCSCTKVILPCREPLRQGTVEGPSGVHFFPRVAWWTSQWLSLTCHTGGQSASPDQWSRRACHRCWARWQKAPWPQGEIPEERWGSVNRNQPRNVAVPRKEGRLLWSKTCSQPTAQRWAALLIISAASGSPTDSKKPWNFLTRAEPAEIRSLCKWTKLPRNQWKLHLFIYSKWIQPVKQLLTEYKSQQYKADHHRQQPR